MAKSAKLFTPPGWKKNVVIKRDETLYRLVDNGVYKEFSGSGLWYFRATYVTIGGMREETIYPLMGDVVIGTEVQKEPEKSKYVAYHNRCTFCDGTIDKEGNCPCLTTICQGCNNILMRCVCHEADDCGQY